MKKTFLLSLVSATILMSALETKATYFPGEAHFFNLQHFTGCDFIPPFPSSPAACTLEINIPITSWFDPPLIVASGLDLLATKDQQERVIDTQEALAKLEESLSSECSGDNEDGSESSLTGADSVPVAPDIVLVGIDDVDGFEKVRTASEGYLFESDTCDEDCVLERQNTWLLTSISMAASSADKLLASSSDMSQEYQNMLSDFNGQKSPKGMWGSTSKITLHSHVQQNDINALYARDLEMNSLAGVRESGKIKIGKK
jgi:hypothetical protein